MKGLCNPAVRIYCSISFRARGVCLMLSSLHTGHEKTAEEEGMIKSNCQHFSSCLVFPS